MKNVYFHNLYKLKFTCLRVYEASVNTNWAYNSIGRIRACEYKNRNKGFKKKKNSITFTCAVWNLTFNSGEFCDSTAWQSAFPQIKLFSFCSDLVISPHLSPPAARSPALPAAGLSLFLLVDLRCCSHLLVYNPLLHASGTFNSLHGKWYLCMNVSAFKICDFLKKYCNFCLYFKQLMDVCV